MTALSGNAYNATTDATGGIYLLDFSNTAGTGFIIPESYKHWYYNGNRYNSKKEALATKNKDNARLQAFLLQWDDVVTIQPKMTTLRQYHLIKPRTFMSRRQQTYQKRKMRLHNG